MFSTSDKETQRWLEDLVTTKAKQGREQLGSAKEGYCCLGRACMVLDPKCSTGWNREWSVQPSSILPALFEPLPMEVARLFGEYTEAPVVNIFLTANDSDILLTEKQMELMEELTSGNRMNFKDIALLACLVEAVLNDPPSDDKGGFND